MGNRDGPVCACVCVCVGETKRGLNYISGVLKPGAHYNYGAFCRANMLFSLGLE